MAQDTKAKQAQRRRLAKPKSPVRVQKGKKRKSKPVIGPRAGIPAGLAEALRKRRAKKAAAAKKKRAGVKRILSTPKKKKP
jgi:hypothetical protein